MAKHKHDDGAVEAAWKFAIGDAVQVGNGAAEVVWRRENSAGERDYLVRTEAGEAWHPEGELSA